MISAVIPAYNEADRIGQVIRGCFRYCDEVIVIDMVAQIIQQKRPLNMEQKLYGIHQIKDIFIL